MNKTVQQHIPVLLEEVMSYLMTSPKGIYIDATFGRGGHARAILDSLSPTGQLIILDKDPQAIAYAKQSFSQDKRCKIFHCSFARLHLLLNELAMAGHITGVLFDLGVSSPQLDDPERGFSFSCDGRLDMRMDTTQGIDARHWLAEVDESTLADILWKYGEERFARRIARAIVAARIQAPITTTLQLAEIIKQAIPRAKNAGRHKHPATRGFQAIRLAINQEMSELQSGLAQALEVLVRGGRLAVISFHSLEDRLVKQFIKQYEKGQTDLPRLPIKSTPFQAKLKSITRAIKPSLQEIHFNSRARSAILRIAEKVS